LSLVINAEEEQKFYLQVEQMLPTIICTMDQIFNFRNTEMPTLGGLQIPTCNAVATDGIKLITLRLNVSLVKTVKHRNARATY